MSTAQARPWDGKHGRYRGSPAFNVRQYLALMLFMAFIATVVHMALTPTSEQCIDGGAAQPLELLKK
jgi:hypothetical protein